MGEQNCNKNPRVIIIKRFSSDLSSKGPGFQKLLTKKTLKNKDSK